MAHDAKNPRTQTNLTNGDRRRDYGPSGCAGIVLAPVVLIATLFLRGGRR